MQIVSTKLWNRIQIERRNCNAACSAITKIFTCMSRLEPKRLNINRRCDFQLYSEKCRRCSPMTFQLGARFAGYGTKLKWNWRREREREEKNCKRRNDIRIYWWKYERPKVVRHLMMWRRADEANHLRIYQFRNETKLSPSKCICRFGWILLQLQTNNNNLSDFKIQLSDDSCWFEFFVTQFIGWINQDTTEVNATPPLTECDFFLTFNAGIRNVCSLPQLSVTL